MKIKEGQIISLKKALNEVTGMTDSAQVYIVNALVINQEITALADLDRSSWEILRNKLYPNWRNEDWTLDVKMRRKIAALLARYREEVTGQLRLF